MLMKFEYNIEIYIYLKTKFHDCDATQKVSATLEFVSFILDLIYEFIII